MDVDDVEPATQDILGKTISDLQNFLANRPDRHEMMQDALTPLLKTSKSYSHLGFASIVI